VKKALSNVGLWVAAAVVAVGVSADAHAKLKKSEPAEGASVASPKNVQLWFSETLDPKLSKIAVSGGSGVIKMGPVHATSPTSIVADVAGPLSSGPYSVAWQTAGDDGHVVKGKYSFTVK